MFRDIIRLSGYGLEAVVADGKFRIPTSFDNYSSIILNNVAKRQLPKGFLTRLEQFAKQGGGVLMLGGNRSYGLGGFKDTPLEKIAPLKFKPPSTKARRLNVAVALVMDKSGSMAQQGKIVAANKQHSCRLNH